MDSQRDIEQIVETCVEKLLGRVPIATQNNNVPVFSKSQRRKLRKARVMENLLAKAQEMTPPNTTIINQPNTIQQPRTEAYHNNNGEFVIPIGKCYCFICKTTIDPIDLLTHTSSCIRKKEKENVTNVATHSTSYRSDPQENSSKEKRKRVEDNSPSKKKQKKALSHYQYITGDKNTFQRLIGISLDSFFLLHDELKQQLTLVSLKQTYHKRVGMGRPRQLSSLEQLCLTLEWMRQGETYFSIGVKYRLNVSSSYKYIQTTLSILYDAFKNEIFVPEERLNRISEAVVWKDRLVVMIVDGSEQQIKVFRNDRYFERSTYSGKKSKHTFSAIIGVTPRKGRIVVLTPSFNGSLNDAGIYTRCKDLFENRLESDEHIGGDPAFSVIKHASVVSTKRKAGCALLEIDKEFNHQWACVRIVVENTIAHVKSWKVCTRTLFFSGTTDDGRQFHNKLWTVACGLVNRYSLPRN